MPVLPSITYLFTYLLTYLLPFTHIHSQRTKHNRNIYNTVDFDPTYCLQTKYCLQQPDVEKIAGCNEQNLVYNIYVI